MPIGLTKKGTSHILIKWSNTVLYSPNKNVSCLGSETFFLSIDRI
jgi:hypothetical protein